MQMQDLCFIFFLFTEILKICHRGTTHFEVSVRHVLRLQVSHYTTSIKFIINFIITKR